ncbi:MAG: hypothetical protein DLM69_11715 [Candidatus Chloroheliales bacterium]|nr:MAG: hypothetical protein DLM69_11715 [Chloroflexota bacterium]
MQPKRLYRSINDRRLAGVAGGLGDYLGIDPTIIRILFVLFALATAVVPTFIVYIILAAVLQEGYTSYGNQPQQPYQQPGVAQPNSMQGAIDNVVGSVERVGREIGSALGLNRNNQPGYPPQPGYQPPQPPQAQPSTYQGSNQLENMGTPVTDTPQPQREAAPIPPAPQPYSGEAPHGYGGNPNLGNMGQGGNGGQSNPGYGPGSDGHTMHRMQGGAMVMRHNPWAAVLFGLLVFAFLPMLIFAGLHLFGFGAGMVFPGVGWGFHGIGWLFGRILPLLIIALVIAALVSRGRRHRGL